MVGANTLVTKSLEDKSVLLTKPTEVYRLNTDQFVKMSACFKI